MPINLTINKAKHPIYIWASNLESQAMDQAVNIADKMPVWHHVSVMPDGHTGFGMPIGGVVGLENAISPMGVGSDIGCGMFSVRLNIKNININDQKEIFKRIRTLIPVGFSHRTSHVEWEGFDTAPTDSKIIKQQLGVF